MRVNVLRMRFLVSLVTLICLERSSGLSAATAAIDAVPPSVPQNLRASPQTTHSIRIEWDPSTDNVGVAGYRVYRNNVIVAQTVNRTFLDENLNEDTEYDYSVSAHDTSANVSLLSALSRGQTFSSRGEPAEFWAGLNKDGNWRNSSAQSLPGKLQVRWAQALTNLPEFHKANSVCGKTGMRSNSLSVRDGRILLVTPTTNPLNRFAGYANFGVLSLRDGSLLTSSLSPHTYGGGILNGTCSATMDTDTPSGIINQYWNRNGVVYTAHGGDHTMRMAFDPFTGEKPLGVEIPDLAGSVNASGYFAMSDSNPAIYARGGSTGHTAFDPGAAVGILGGGKAPISAMKLYASFVLDGDWIYSYNVTNVQNRSFFSPVGYGVSIVGHKVTAAPAMSVAKYWTYTDANKGMLSFGVNHASGAPRAFTLGEDGRLYYYGFHTVGSGFTQIPDGSRGFVLVGVRTSDGKADREIPLGFGPFSGSQTQANSFSILSNLLPQIATRGDRVVIFQPQQNGISEAHLFAADTSTGTLAWQVDFPAGYFQTNTAKANMFNQTGDSPEQAVQVTIAGDSAFVVEPYEQAGRLVLRIERFLLADGTRSIELLAPLDSNGQPIKIQRIGQIALREVAAVDGSLIVQVDYDHTSQAVVAIEGEDSMSRDFAPVAVISAPVTGARLFNKSADGPLPSTNQFDAHLPIAFHSVGSIDPDGGALTYRWDFGDGTTSSEANPTHVYEDLGAVGSLTPRVVTLAVTDDEGNESRQVNRQLLIRSPEGLQVVIAADVDSFVNYGMGPDFTNQTTNFGYSPYLYLTARPQNLNGTQQRAFVTFDLSALGSASIVSATLRVFTAPINGLARTNSALGVESLVDSWFENVINGTNAPVAGALLGSTPLAAGVGSFVNQLDIKLPPTYFANKSSASLALALSNLHATSLLSMTLYSRESRNPVQLILQLDSSTVPSQPPGGLTGTAALDFQNDSIPPSTPNGLSVTAGFGYSTALRWNASTDNVNVVNYLIFRDQMQVAKIPANKLAWNSPNLFPGLTYNYSIVAVDWLGNSSPRSASVAYSVRADTKAPSVPTGLVASTVAASTIQVSWRAASDDSGRVAGYKVYLNGSLVVTTGNLSFMLANLTPKTSYSVSVAAYDFAGNLSAQAAPLLVTTLADLTPPTAPSYVRGNFVAGRGNVTWGGAVDNVRIRHYLVYRNGVLRGQSTTWSFADTLIPGVANQYYVVTVDTSGNVSPASVSYVVNGP